MNIKFPILGFLFITLFLNTFTQAEALELSVRQLPSSEYVAEIDYIYGCGRIHVTEVESVQIVGNSISIKSPEHDPIICGVQAPSVNLIAGTNIGVLEAGEYTLDWEQSGDFLLSTVFTVIDGPLVPCTDCESLTQAPLPESGLWHNPEQSPGSGLNFEIQNGVLAGFFYGYSNNGQPEWHLVSGELLVSEEIGVLWELETTLTRAEGGSCIDCEFSPPDQITEGAVIRLEFMQRNYVRVSIGGVFDQYFVPFTYGSSGKAYFAEQTPYLFPEFTDNAIFILTIRPDQGEEINVYSWESEQVVIQEASVSTNAGITNVSYIMRNHGPRGPVISPTPPPFGVITCTQESIASAPGCVVEIDGRIFTMPVGNFGDSRFFAEAEDGMTVEGHRIDYD